MKNCFQATYGEPGLTYSYSGIQTPARPWLQPLRHIRDLLTEVTGHYYNFVLVNRLEAISRNTFQYF